MNTVKGNIYQIPTPFIVYTGPETQKTMAKVASGLMEWSPSKVSNIVGDYNIYDSDKFIGNVASTNFHELDAPTLVIGIAPFGGKIDAATIQIALKAISCGKHVAAGLHDRLTDIPELVTAAHKQGTKLYDFRHRDISYAVGTGQPRDGYRVLTVGTDCACGKKYTSLALNAMTRLAIMETQPTEPLSSHFCSTGQTGFLISGSGINNDTIGADFLSGAAEWLSPSDERNIYFVEGQGALRHPGYCGGSYSLLCGSQPDMIIMCHTPNRDLMAGTSVKIDLDAELRAVRDAIHNFNLNSEIYALSINTTGLSSAERDTYLSYLSESYPTLVVFEPSALDIPMHRVVSAILDRAQTKQSQTKPKKMN